MLPHPDTCRGCPMDKIGGGFVAPVGPPNAKIRFIGEAPGSEEESEGRPWVGAVGKELERSAKQAGIVWEETYRANTIQCRPPGNDYDLVHPDAIPYCATAHVEPARDGCVVFLVGGKSLVSEWPDATSIETWHGSVLRRE